MNVPDQPYSDVKGRLSLEIGLHHHGDQALEIDCTDIARRAPIRSRFLKGFVVIQSATDLDVVGVYTAANAADGRVVTLEIEHVPVRHVAQR